MRYTSPGTIFSPHYPHKMQDGEPCSYAIQAPTGSRIVLTFKEFNLTTPFLSNPKIFDVINCLNGEHINVHSGDSSASDLIETFCYPSNIPDRIISSDEYIFIDFIASSFIDHGRYKIEFSFHDMGNVEKLLKRK